MFLDDDSTIKREEAETALRKYRELVEHANCIILNWTNDGKITFLNNFGLRFFGYSAEEIIGRHVMDTIVPAIDENGRDMGKMMEQIFTDPASYEHNVNMNVRRNGERVYVAWTNRVIKDVNGKVEEIQSVGIDITELKQVGEKLKESETQLSLILNNVSDVVFAVAVEPNDNFRFTLVNRRFLDITGLPENRIVGKLVRDVIPQPSHDIVFQKYREAIQSRLPAQWEEVSEYPMGKKIGHVTVVPVFDARGACTHLIGMVHDITERAQAEKALKDSETHYRYLFEQSPVPMLIYESATLNMLAVNDAFLAQYGYSKAEILAMHLTDLYPEPEKKALVDLIKTLHGHVYAGEWHHLKKDGTAITIEVFSQGFNFEGRASRIAVLTDITKRKQAEEALQESESKFRAIFENSRDAIIVIKNGIIVFGNSAVVKLFGYTSFKELEGTSVLDHVAPSHKQQISELHEVEKQPAKRLPVFMRHEGEERTALSSPRK